MIPFVVSFVEFVLATFIPLYLGMFLAGAVRTARIESRYLSAFALGLLFWFFLDTLNDAIQLGVNDGYDFNPQHTGLLLMFILGFLAIALPAGVGLSKRTHTILSPTAGPFLTALLIAIGMGFHGIGEGLEFGGLSAGTTATTILDAIGGVGGGIAYVLHKFLEASLVMIVFIALGEGERFSFRVEWKRIVLLGLAFGIPSALGDVVGYFVEVNSTYLFALGGGAALVVALFAVRPIWGDGWKGGLTYAQYVKMVLMVLMGFLCLYGAAMFHS
ncbi:MAG: hypothetical protein WB643_10285 [Candidatus Bathyarchaeia archaeon]